MDNKEEEDLTELREIFQSTLIGEMTVTNLIQSIVMNDFSKSNIMTVVDEVDQKFMNEYDNCEPAYVRKLIREIALEKKAQRYLIKFGIYTRDQLNVAREKMNQLLKSKKTT